MIRSQPTLVVQLNPSRRLACILIAVHLLAVGFVLSLAIPAWLKGAAALGVVGSLAFHLLRHALLRSGKSAVGLEIGADGSCTLATRDGGRVRCRLLGTSFVSPWLAVLNLAPELERRGRSVTILPDSLSAEDFRALRVWLRWKLGEGVTTRPGQDA